MIIWKKIAILNWSTQIFKNSNVINKDIPRTILNCQCFALIDLNVGPLHWRVHYFRSNDTWKNHEKYKNIRTLSKYRIWVFLEHPDDAFSIIVIVPRQRILYLSTPVISSWFAILKKCSGEFVTPMLEKVDENSELNVAAAGKNYV